VIPTLLTLVHSSDLHLGKSFGRLSEDLRGRLREARHEAVARLAGVASEEGASAILVAGDLFDTETPAPAILRQALAAMAAAPVIWVLLPGNHDSLAAVPLWEQVARHRPPNVRLALEPRPIDLGPDAVLLPAPCTQRRPGRDLTDWMNGAATSPGTLRIGLAHGGVKSFSEEHEGGVIAPDRPSRAGLDYLALGDWHGQMRIGPRLWYPGTPERDSFKHAGPAGCLVVRLPGSGVEPEIRARPTGRFDWRAGTLDLLPGEDAAARLDALLALVATPRDTLFEIAVRGRATLAGRAALAAAAAERAPGFGHLALDEAGLGTEYEPDDLDAIDRAGALRDAAERLRAEAADPALAADAREAARGALARLHAYVAGTP
jgi:DNA repair exonuclease SbcCD nuclease subunit